MSPMTWKTSSRVGLCSRGFFFAKFPGATKAPQPQDEVMASRFSKFGSDRLVTAIMIAIVLLFASNAQAQRSRHLLRGNMIPGQASQIRALGSPSKAGQNQPVKLIVPDGVELSIVSSGSFAATAQPSHTVGIQLGSLYRFRVTGVDVGTSFELYPSVELLDLLRPPAGLENDFPIPIVMTASDIREASAGRLVTKVIYLEDPEVALPRAGNKNEQPSFDVSAAEDPVRTAAGLGRPMAILRIGSRVPTSVELANSSSNAFNSATPQLATESFQPGLRINPKYRHPVFPNPNVDAKTKRNPMPIPMSLPNPIPNSMPIPIPNTNPIPFSNPIPFPNSIPNANLNLNPNLPPITVPSDNPFDFN